MNVNSIHNATFSRSLPPTFLAQARDLANWHEYNTLSSPQLDGIGNSKRLLVPLDYLQLNNLVIVAGRTVLPSMITGLERIANASDPLTFIVQAISYKPFLSLFNMTGAAAANPGLAGISERSAPSQLLQ
jgi:prostatic aicd phosphatase